MLVGRCDARSRMQEGNGDATAARSRARVRFYVVATVIWLLGTTILGVFGWGVAVVGAIALGVLIGFLDIKIVGARRRDR
jgi:hypothetical protein